MGPHPDHPGYTPHHAGTMATRRAVAAGYRYGRGALIGAIHATTLRGAPRAGYYGSPESPSQDPVFKSGVLTLPQGQQF